MPKANYNWQELKAEFIKSQYLEATAFFKHKFGHYNEHMKRKARGWTKEKQLHQEKIQAKVIEKAIDSEAREMAKALGNIRSYFKMKVSSLDELKKLKVKDARDIWKIIRIENNLPANIIKAHNINEDKDPEKLLDELNDRETKTETTDEI